ncbi:MAG: hypothetical protein AAGI68_14210 [Planctomycetota bacterium]
MQALARHAALALAVALIASTATAEPHRDHPRLKSTKALMQAIPKAERDGVRDGDPATLQRVSELLTHEFYNHHYRTDGTIESFRSEKQGDAKIDFERKVDAVMYWITFKTDEVVQGKLYRRLTMTTPNGAGAPFTYVGGGRNAGKIKDMVEEGRHFRFQCYVRSVKLTAEPLTLHIDVNWRMVPDKDHNEQPPADPGDG